MFFCFFFVFFSPTIFFCISHYYSSLSNLFLFLFWLSQICFFIYFSIIFFHFYHLNNFSKYSLKLSSSNHLDVTVSRATSKTNICIHSRAFFQFTTNVFIFIFYFFIFSLQNISFKLFFLFSKVIFLSLNFFFIFFFHHKTFYLNMFFHSKLSFLSLDKTFINFFRISFAFLNEFVSIYNHQFLIFIFINT